jgi:hypothetical protein
MHALGQRILSTHTHTACSLLHLHEQLDDGSAEIFGAELQLGVPVNIKGQKLAVFSWTGCTVHIRGVPADMIM